MALVATMVPVAGDCHRREPVGQGVAPMRPRLTVLAAVMVLVLVACSSGASSSPSSLSATPAATVELTIYGAASLKGALEKAKTAYEAAVPGTTLTISTDSSAALETKIEQGAPADVFLSADSKNPRKLIDAGLADGDPVPFAGNRLTVIVPADNPAGIGSPADLARPGVKVIAAGDEVPITKYATQLVGNLAREAGYPADFVAAYTANIVSKEDNVKAVVAKIELGEGDAGIVYVTDAKASAKVATIDVPDSANAPATYAGVVVRESRNAAAAQAFLAWFAGPDGRAILAGFGFLPPPP
jgi:molybdate transport system substrate-binding protein